MKKKILIVSCVAIAIAGVWSVSKINSEELASNDLLMENVEALSMGETKPQIKIKCYTSFKYELGASVVDCTTCSLYPDHTDALFNFHDECYK